MAQCCLQKPKQYLHLNFVSSTAYTYTRNMTILKNVLLQHDKVHVAMGYKGYRKSGKFRCKNIFIDDGSYENVCTLLALMRNRVIPMKNFQHENLSYKSFVKFPDLHYMTRHYRQRIVKVRNNIAYYNVHVCTINIIHMTRVSKNAIYMYLQQCIPLERKRLGVHIHNLNRYLNLQVYPQNACIQFVSGVSLSSMSQSQHMLFYNLFPRLRDLFNTCKKRGEAWDSIPDVGPNTKVGRVADQ